MEQRRRFGFVWLTDSLDPHSIFCHRQVNPKNNFRLIRTECVELDDGDDWDDPGIRSTHHRDLRPAASLNFTMYGFKIQCITIHDAKGEARSKAGQDHQAELRARQETQTALPRISNPADRPYRPPKIPCREYTSVGEDAMQGLTTREKRNRGWKKKETCPQNMSQWRDTLNCSSSRQTPCCSNLGENEGLHLFAAVIIILVMISLNVYPQNEYNGENMENFW